MTDFKKADRDPSGLSPWRRSLRQFRSSCLKGMTVVRQKSQPAIRNLFRHYKTPLIATGAAVLAVVGVFIGAHQYVQAHTNSYYKVILNGQPIGEISDRQLVEQAIEAKSAALAAAKTDIAYKLDEAKVTYEDVSAFKKAPDDEATLNALYANLKSHPVGVKLVINGKDVAIVKNKETANAILKRVQERFVPAQAASKSTVTALSYDASKQTQTAKSTRVVKSVEFEEEVTTVPVDIDLTQLDDPEVVYKKLATGNPAKRTYTVQEGDCVGCIAQKMKVPTAVIYANNTWIENDQIKPGDVLDITQKNPILNVKSEEEVTEIETIDPPVEIRKSDDIKLGQSKTIREGKNGKRQVTYRLIKRNGASIEEEQVSSKVLEPAVSTIILKGTKVIPSEGSGDFIWPVKSHRITSYMGKRWGSYHRGIDMVGNKSIMAADNGTVEFAGKKGTYGNAVIINHNNGFKTLYGHMSSIKVKKGQVVSQGDIIGIMGSTGHSTGTHLHFEVELNGSLRNPTSYL
ncbi:peptidoglycan DD-metalloendopeptidase family protein [Cohnella xylanilytica]|uniref:Peptidoglycan DD-metalloendopeptidase family protein n=1 Tax=Cohnella xylanilytica TaxID=557555 RepID=A0A841UAZ9_9BACL|nr:M23 family metallopeptidase [Cohnella xylanilytica]MBB6695100.1 peptidoglycan DD-metalloendopeptidase family protein [Cohnella xylanilytica]